MSGHNLQSYEQASRHTPRISPNLSAATKTRLGMAIAGAATGFFVLGRTVSEHLEGRHNVKRVDGNLGQKVHGPIKYFSKHENRYNIKDDTLANYNKMASQYYKQPAVMKEAK